MQIKLKYLKYGATFVHNGTLFRKLTDCQDMETYHAGNDRPKHEMCFAFAIANKIDKHWIPCCLREPIVTIPQSDLLKVEQVHLQINVIPA